MRLGGDPFLQCGRGRIFSIRVVDDPFRMKELKNEPVWGFIFQFFPCEAGAMAGWVCRLRARGVWEFLGMFFGKGGFRVVVEWGG